MASGSNPISPELERPAGRSPHASSWISSALLTIAAVALPWSNDVPTLMGVVMSRIFVAAQVLMVMHWAFTVKSPFRFAPKAYGVFVVFVAVHTLATYGILGPAELFTSDFSAVLGQEMAQIALRAVVVAKFFVFALTGYAVASTAGGEKSLTRVGLGIGSSVVVLLVLGRSQQMVDITGRFTGGYSNANAFAEVCLAVMFLNIFTLFAQDSGRLLRLVALLLVACAAAGLLLSASRTALIAALAGAAAVFAVTSGRYRALLLASGAGALLLVILVSPENVFDLVYRRSTASLINLRPLIWGAYLQQWREYVAVGVGLGREMTVLAGPIYLDRIWPPHNTLLQVTVAYGFVGPVLFLNLLATCLRRAWNVARGAEGLNAGAIVLGIVVCWFVLMFSGDRLGARIFWVLFGLVFAVLKERPREGESANCPPARVV